MTREPGAGRRRAAFRSSTVPRLGLLLMLALVALAGALFAADRVLDGAGLGFAPMQSRADADEVLVRKEFRTRLVTNALGFRERRLPAPPPAGTLRVVALGDSFTQGYGVSDEERFTQLLEPALARRVGRPVEVINLGVPGATVHDYLYHLRDVGLRYAPDVVLVGFMANDVADVRGLLERRARGIVGTLRRVRAEVLDARPRWKRWPHRLWPVLYDVGGARLHDLRQVAATDTAEAAAHPASGPAEVPHLPEAQWRAILREVAARYGRAAEVDTAVARMDPARLAVLRDVVEGRWRFEDEVDQTPLWAFHALIDPRIFVDSVLLSPGYEAAWRESAARLVELVGVVRAAGARPVVAFIPAAQQVMPEEGAFLASHGFAWDERVLSDTTLADRLVALGARHGFPVIDLLPVLRRARTDAAPPYFVEDGHWTASGHAVAAAALAREMPLP